MKRFVTIKKSLIGMMVICIGLVGIANAQKKANHAAKENKDDVASVVLDVGIPLKELLERSTVNGVNCLIRTNGKKGYTLVDPKGLPVSQVATFCQVVVDYATREISVVVDLQQGGDESRIYLEKTEKRTEKRLGAKTLRSSAELHIHEDSQVGSLLIAGPLKIQE